ncbi:hypothetical protein GCM10009700_14800 [Brevibacterium sanguinis]
MLRHAAVVVSTTIPRDATGKPRDRLGEVLIPTPALRVRNRGEIAEVRLTLMLISLGLWA